jgi:Tol biopolymer transport system component
VSRREKNCFYQLGAWTETELASGDRSSSLVISYKPDDSEGLSHFNDNRRLHIFLADLASGQVQQLTDGTHYEHSIDWSPNGEKLPLFPTGNRTKICSSTTTSLL